MTRDRCWRSLAAAALAAALGCAPGGARADTVLSLHYRVFFGGVSTAAVAISATIAPRGYTISAETDGEGPFGWVTGFVSSAVSRGRAGAAAIDLLAHSARSRWFGEDRSVELQTGPDGTVAARVVPPPADDDRDPVAPAATVGTLDPLSASLQAAGVVARTGMCDQRIAVFDGRRRYDLVLDGTRRETLAAPAYSGPAVRCRVTMVQIAGFSRDPYIPRPAEPPESELWFARIADDLPLIPVQLRSTAAFATTVINLESLDVQGSTDPALRRLLPAASPSLAP